MDNELFEKITPELNKIANTGIYYEEIGGTVYYEDISKREEVRDGFKCLWKKFPEASPELKAKAEKYVKDAIEKGERLPEVLYKTIKPPKKVSDWKGLFVRSKCETSTPVAVFKKGTVFLVKSSGFAKTLETLPCKCCGIKATMRVVESAEYFLNMFEFVEQI